MRVAVDTSPLAQTRAGTARYLKGLLRENAATFTINVDQITAGSNIDLYLDRADKLAFLKSLSVFSVPAIYGEAFGLFTPEKSPAAIPATSTTQHSALRTERAAERRGAPAASSNSLLHKPTTGQATGHSIHHGHCSPRKYDAPQPADRSGHVRGRSPILDRTCSAT